MSSKFRVGDRVTVAHHLIDPRLDDMDGEVGKVASIYLSYAASSKLPSKHYRLESQNSELNARFSKLKFEEKHLEKLPTYQETMKRPTDAEMPSKGKPAHSNKSVCKPAGAAGAPDLADPGFPESY